jgi:hypothetical protein
VRADLPIPKFVSVLICIAAIAGCGGSSAGPELKPESEAQVPTADLKAVPATPIAIQDEALDKPTWNPAWNMLIEQALPSNLLSQWRAKEVRSLCPRFRHLSKGERRAFWAYFFQALAGAEAGLNPATDVHHTDPQVDVIDLVTHRRVRQEGLLQLTYMDDLRYGCDFNWPEDRLLPEHDPSKSILLPENNLVCGLRIVENQLIKRHEPLLSDNSYWSTLRPDNPSFVVFKKQMANVPAYCEVHPHEREREPVESNPTPLVEAGNQPSDTNRSRDTNIAQSAIDAAGERR